MRETMLNSLKHSATRFFILLYSVGIFTLMLTSGGNYYTAIVQLVLTVIDLVFLGITLVVIPRIPPKPQEKDTHLSLQMAFIVLWLVVILLVPQVRQVTSLDSRILNPLVYAIIPVLVLLLGFAVLPTILGFPLTTRPQHIPDAIQHRTIVGTGTTSPTFDPTRRQ